MRWTILLLGFLATFATQTARAEIATIHLNDGTKLRGEVVSLKGGQYTIKGDALGTLQIEQNKIRLVEYGDNSAAVAATSSSSAVSAPDLSANMQQLQRQIMQNPNLISRVQALASNPDVQAIIQDPSIQAAISSGDYQALMNHPKLIQLMQNPEVRAITKEVQNP